MPLVRSSRIQRLHELCLIHAALEERRAHVEEIRAIRQSDTRAERRAVQRRPAVEPLIETLRTGHDDPLCRHVVHRHGLVSLHVVPHEHAVRHVAKDGLAREVVPAPDAQRGRDTRVPSPTRR